MREPCRAAELRALPLFDSLTERQLEELCANGHVTIRPAGPLYTEGERAEQFYVLIDGEAVTSTRSGGVEVDIIRSSRPGKFFGVWSDHPAESERRHQSCVRLTRVSRLFVIDTGAFVGFLRTHFPLALDLHAGHLVDDQRERELLGQREMLLAFGALTAGLTDQLHTAAVALERAIADLRSGSRQMRHALTERLAATLTADALRVLFSAEDELAERAATYARNSRPVAGQPYTAALTESEATERRRSISEWLQDNGVADEHANASTFVGGGVGVDWLARVTTSIGELGGPDALPSVVDRLRQTVDSELHFAEIVDACERISALIAGVKQYSQMDRGVYQSVDVHELLRSTAVMFGDRIAMPGKGRPVTLVKDSDFSLPELLCYPGDLNQVWTHLFDNALQAMDGHGTLTVRTGWEGDSMIRVEICDDGPGIDASIIDRVFDPFFTTRPGATAAGLGLDLARRIVVEKHLGTIEVQSEPGDTRFIVCLPLRAPAPMAPG